MLLAKNMDSNPSWAVYKPPSQMGRMLFGASLSTPATGLCNIKIVTLHLEGGANGAPTRRKQLKLAKVALAPYPRAILCGDFFFDGPRKPPLPNSENAVLRKALGSGYVDVWPALHPDLAAEPGFTLHAAEAAECTRPDRVLVRGMNVRRVTILGRDSDAVVPSSHFGVCADVLLGPRQMDFDGDSCYGVCCGVS
jgi:endonuclease/exonuclease/phosphatase family metal-dependent hydrolase